MKKYKLLKVMVPVIGMILAFGTTSCNYDTAGGGSGGGSGNSTESTEVDYTGVKKKTEIDYNGADFSYRGQRWVSEFNTKGKLVTYTTYNSEDTEIEKIEYEYDANGNVSVEKISGTFQNNNVVTKTYDAQNRLILELIEYEDTVSNLVKRVEHTYETKKETRTDYDAEEGGNILQQIIQIYNDDGKVVDYYWVNKKESYVYAKRTYTYDSKGRETNMKNYAYGGIEYDDPVSETTRTYNDSEHSQRIVNTYYTDGMPNSSTIIYFDDKNNPLKNLNYDKDGKLLSCYSSDYTYNEKGYMTEILRKNSNDGTNFEISGKRVAEYEYY